MRTVSLAVLLALALPVAASAAQAIPSYVAKAVQDAVAEGIIPADEADDLYILVGVFIHWEAADDAKIQKYNYEATKLSIQRAVNGEPKASTVTEQRNSAQHPFAANA